MLSESMPSRASFAKESNSKGLVESMLLVLFAKDARHLVFSFVCASFLRVVSSSYFSVVGKTRSLHDHVALFACTSLLS